ncbi:hypothetical protein CR513_21835, partial [Mucuna pruriens]
MMLSMMISGPRQLGNSINVFLWNESIDIFDGYCNQNFNMHAMLFCTINDFPLFGNLSKYSVKGHKICHICEKGTRYHQLTHGRKTCYHEHKKFLKTNNLYRQ